MSTLNLPAIPEAPPEKEKELPVIKEVVEEPLTQDKMFKPKEAPVQVNVEPAEPPKKPKRKMSEKQLANLANMRKKRAEKYAAKKKEKAGKIPDNAVPVVKKQTETLNEAPPVPKMEKNGDGFYNFVNYMEKYKNLKKTWREREAEKQRARAPPPAPAPAKPAPPPKPKVDIKKAGPNHRQVIAKKQIPSVLNTGNKPGLYDSYF